MSRRKISRQLTGLGAGGKKQGCRVATKGGAVHISITREQDFAERHDHKQCHEDQERLATWALALQRDAIVPIDATV